MKDHVIIKKRRFLFPESDIGRRVVDVQLVVAKAQRKFKIRMPNSFL